MPLLQVYRCQVCDTAVTTPYGAPVPLHCGQPARWRQLRDHKPEEHGWSTGMRSAAIGFRNTNPWVVPIEGNGPNGQREVSSLREIRHIEKESEKMAADGVGQELRFRAFNNDVKGGGRSGGGMMTNSFGPPPQRAPKLYDERGRQKISFEAVDGETCDADEMGPGATEALASALPESPL